MDSKISLREIALLTAKAFGITPKELDVRTGSTDRQCHARFAICALAREFRPEKSYSQIRVLFGYRDHTSVIHGLRATPKLVGRDEVFAGKFHLARASVIAWKPGDSVPGGSIVFAPGERAGKLEPASRVKSGAPSAFAFLAHRLSRVSEKETAA
jgi:hypothetical protein